VLPLVGSGHAPHAHAVEFRAVTATGSYEADHTALVRNRQVNGDTGFLVVTPLRTAGGTLLVVRGFVSASGTAAIPTAPAPPSGQVTVTARVQPAETRNDKAAGLADHQVESINPGQQSTRLGEQVFDGYAQALDGQPGVGQLIAIPKPDLSNPAGGAIEPQHLAYIIQWYLFALLALAAPIAMVRAETREHVTSDFDEVAEPEVAATTEPRATTEPAVKAEPTAQQIRAAKLADRYGRAVR
jgi:cytochrome oxidase assembly protein ShyY1